MKTRMLIIAITFFSVQMFASEIIFNSHSSKAFQIVIDNYCYTSNNGQIAINNLAAGNYQMQIASNPNVFGEFRNINYQTIHVNPYTRTFCDINSYGTSSIAYVEALRPSSNIYVTVNLKRPVIRPIIYSQPATYRPARVNTGHARPVQSQAINSRPATSKATRGPRNR
jgi:hypothetical protein